MPKIFQHQKTLVTVATQKSRCYLCRLCVLTEIADSPHSVKKRSCIWLAHKLFNNDTSTRLRARKRAAEYAVARGVGDYLHINFARTKEWFHDARTTARVKATAEISRLMEQEDA
jgi:hypothetical protein